jgi:1-deoxy-D-xylulose-5-phosphate reductoisomerase
MVTCRALPLTSERPRRISILGATGSIGSSTLAVIAEHPREFEVVAVTANDNAARLAEIARSVGARLAVIASSSAYGELKAALEGSNVEAAAGPAAVEAAAGQPVDIVVAAIVGAAGLAPTLAAVKAGSHVALANKECLVCAGDLFMSAARNSGNQILPVDSEHNAIFQALDGQPHEEVERIILTASGGPFRGWSKDAMATVTAEQALKHPNWSMGPKITIDSATLMNKGLEVIEAHHLFEFFSGQPEVVIHPQSVIHGIVAFRDGSMLAQMSAPDMRTPIAHCLAWPGRKSVASRRLDLVELGRMTFEAPDLDRFPALRLARQALDTGGWATNILNAANEIAVQAFLDGAIGFLEIVGIVEETISRAAALNAPSAPNSTEEAMFLDREGRRIARDLVAARKIPAIAAAGSG